MVKTTIALLILTLLTKGLQVIYFPLIATIFGVSKELESFFVAYSIPTFICSFFLMNFRTMFIPLFAQQKLRMGETSAWKFTSSLINIILLCVLALVLLGIIFSSWFVKLAAPGMDATYQALGVRLTQILFITIISTALTVILSSILQSYESFIFQGATLLVGQLTLTGILFLMRQGTGIYVLVWAILVSQGCVLVLLLGASKRIWWRQYTLKMDAEPSLIKDALLMFISVSMVGSLWQINLIVNRVFASFLPPGNIAVLEYASRSMIFIVEFLGLSIIIPIYQNMATASAAGDQSKVRDTFSLGVKMTAVVLFPLIAFIIFLRFPVFQIFLEHGQFSLQNTRQVSSAFLYLSMAGVGNGFGLVITGAYCVLRKLRLLFVFSLCGLMFNGLLSFILYRVMGVDGLALATGMATLLTTLFSWRALNEVIGGLDTAYLAKFTGKVLAAALISGTFSWFLFHLMGRWTGVDLFSQIVKLGVSAASCGVAYIVLMSFLKMGEINFVLDVVKDRIKSIKEFQFFRL